MTNKIGSVVLLLSCIFISLGFGLLFQNKMALEGYTTNDDIMSKFKEVIDAQIRADKVKQPNTNYTNARNELTALMNAIKPNPKSNTTAPTNTIIVQCINYIIGLDLHTQLQIDYQESRKYRLTYMKNFIILPNEPIDQAPEIIKQLDSILMLSNKKNWEKIKDIKSLAKTFAQ
jgi:hypothetical protein